ncbi:MAG: rhomboid family intramembrane serine protease [bacterium]|jgi:membrane associated rhomboid family serine protease
MEDIIRYTPVSSLIFVFTILTSLYGFYGNSHAFRGMMLHPYSIHRKKKYYTILTSGFIHADFNHLIFNMLSYFFFAFSLEKIVGHWQYALIYISGIVLSDISSILKNKNNSSYYSLGASGAISSVLFSYILFDPHSKIYLFFIPIGIPAFIFALLYLAYCMYASKNQSDHINHEAHFWGAINGWVITTILFPHVFGYFIKSILG